MMIEWDTPSLTRNEKDQSVRARDSARALPLQSVAVVLMLVGVTFGLRRVTG